jgi:hypothetical protein
MVEVLNNLLAQVDLLTKETSAPKAKVLHWRFPVRRDAEGFITEIEAIA